MKTIFTLTFVLLTMISSTLLAGGEDDFIKGIMKAAEVNKDQAKGGAGALFEMAKENMEKSDFDKVSEVIPDMGGLLAAVPKVGGTSSSLLGSAATQLTGMPKVLAVFDKLGISRDKVELFTPFIVNYVEKKGGKVLSNLLANSFKK
jgi:hypothetical protein